METKSLRLKKLLSGRVIRNTRGFGWHLYDASDVTETTTWLDSVDAENVYDNKWKLTPHYNSETKYFIDLTFYRKNEWFKNLGSIKILEFFYNFVFILRRIIGAILPPAFVIFMIMSMVTFSKNNSEAGSVVGAIFGGIFMSWILLMILEDIFSGIARGILKPADDADASLRVQSDGSYGYASGYGNNISIPKKIFLSLLSVVSTAVALFFGGAIGDVIATGIEESGNPTSGILSGHTATIALIGMPIVLLLLVITIVKTWKAKTSRMLFMFLNILVSVVFMIILMISQI